MKNKFKKLFSMVLIFSMTTNIVFASGLEMVGNNNENLDGEVLEEIEHKDDIEVETIEDESELKEETTDIEMDKLDSSTITTYEELKVAIKEFNNGNEDKLISISGDIIFKEDDEMKNNEVDTFIRITNLDNDLTIRGNDKTKFQPDDTAVDLDGKYRLIIIGNYENILKEEISSKGKITIENIDFDGKELVGGIANFEGNLKLINTSFKNHYIKNPKLLGGAGILNANKTELINSEDLEFINNNNKSIYKDNSDEGSGGAIYNTSGMIANDRLKSFMGAENVSEIRKYKIPQMDIRVDGKIIFKNNEAKDGGGIWTDGDMTIKGKEDILFEENSGYQGSGIYNTIARFQINDKFTEKIDKRTINFYMKSEKDIYFNKNTSESAVVFNGAHTDWTYEDIIRNRYVNLTIESVGNTEFNGLGKNEDSDSTGGAVLNQGYYFKYLNDDDSVKEIERVKTDLNIKAGVDLSFKNNYSTFSTAGVQNNLGLLFSERVGLADREAYDINLQAGRNMEFIENESGYNAAGLTNNSVNGINVQAGKDINFIKNKSTGFNSGAIDNSRIYDFQIPALMKLLSQEGEVNFIENENSEGSEAAGAINNAGELKIDAHKDINIRGNIGGERSSVAIRNELGAGYSFDDGLFDVLIKSRDGSVNIFENKSDSDSPFSIISNAGDMDIEARDNINISHNSLKTGSIIFNVPNEKRIVKTNLKTEVGKVDIKSNYIGDKSNPEDIKIDSGIFSNKNEIFGIVNGLSMINIDSMKDISIINNTNLNGALVDFQQKNEFDKNYDEMIAPVNSNDFKNIDFKSRNGKVYIVGNQTNETISSVNNNSLMEFIDYPQEDINLFKEKNFKNMWINDKSIFNNNFKTINTEFEEVDYDLVDFGNELFMLNGMGYKNNDNYNMGKNEISYKIDQGDTNTAKEFIKNMNDSLIIRADIDQTSGAILLGSNEFEEKIKLRDGIKYNGVRDLKAKLETIGAKKQNHYVKGWKVNKNLETGVTEEVILTKAEMKEQILNPMNELLDNLSKTSNDEEFIITMIANIEGSNYKVIKNLPKYKDGLVIVPIWEEGEEPVAMVDVKFDTNTGKYSDGTTSKTKSIEKNSHILETDIERPTKDGYRFKYWSETKTGEGKFDFTKTIDSDKLLYAIWEENLVPVVKVVVKFDADGGKFTDDNTVKSKTIDKGNKVEKITDIPRKSGYTFRGWIKSGESKKFDFDTIINEDIILYADWEKDSGGGKDKPDPEKPKPKPEPEKPKPEPNKDRKGREIGKVLEPKIEFELNMKDHLAYLKGYKDSTIRPNGSLTREEAAMVFYRVMDKGFRDEVKTKNHKFTDIESGRWSEQALATLANANMISGYSDGSFNPTKPITRAELSSMIAKLTDTIVLETEFQDIIEHWAEDYINTVHNKGWVKGDGDGNFRPNDEITRSEFATVLNSILERKINRENALPGIKIFADLDEKSWYYDVLIEAINGHKYKIENGKEIWTELDNREFE